MFKRDGLITSNGGLVTLGVGVADDDPPDTNSTKLDKSGL